MRPRNLRRRVAASAAVIVMMGVGAGYAAEADAQTATLTGTFGINPRWSSVVECPCEPVRYTPWLSQRSIASGVDRLSQRVSRQGAAVEAVDHVAGFSLGAVVAVGFIWDHPEQARHVTFTLIGSPDTPEGRPSKGKGHKGRNGLPDGDWSNVTYVVKQFDPVADPVSKFSWLAAINASLSVHTRGYDGLDLTQPDAIDVDERTGARVLWFRTDDLPILRWVKPWVSEKRYAELDTKYRARIEQAYERPVDLEPKPQAQEQKTWTSAASSESRAQVTTGPSATPGKSNAETNTPAISELGKEPSTTSELKSTRQHDDEESPTKKRWRASESDSQADRGDSRKDSDRQRRPHRSERGTR